MYANGHEFISKFYFRGLSYDIQLRNTDSGLSLVSNNCFQQGPVSRVHLKLQHLTTIVGFFWDTGCVSQKKFFSWLHLVHIFLVDYCKSIAIFKDMVRWDFIPTSHLLLKSASFNYDWHILKCRYLKCAIFSSVNVSCTRETIQVKVMNIFINTSSGVGCFWKFFVLSPILGKEWAHFAKIINLNFFSLEISINIVKKTFAWQRYKT